jgi:hypothetical protein
MARSVQLLAHGIDTLFVNAHFTDGNTLPVKCELDDSLALQLETWKKQAQEVGEPVPISWVFNEKHLLMYPNGAGRGHWQWLLHSSDLALCISRGKWNGGIAQVRFASEYLWKFPSVMDAVVEVHSFLYDLFGRDLLLQPSEVHLCADITGWDDIRDLEYRRLFVSRSRKRTDHTQASSLPDGFKADDFSFGLVRTGLSFSARGSLSCVIYDKSREIKRSDKAWFADLWKANGWDGESPVWRVECRFKRDALHELKQEGVFHGIEDICDLPERLPVLWAYAVGQVGGSPADGLPDGWLRYVVPVEDDNRSRWPTHPTWQAIQGAFLSIQDYPQDFGKIIRKRKEERNIRKGIESVVGYGTSLSAWAGGDLARSDADLSVFLHWLANKGEEYLEEQEREFAKEVQRKRIKLGLQAS